MSPRVRFALFLLGLACAIEACSPSSASDGSTTENEAGTASDGATCSPPPLSCDAPAPFFLRVDPQNDCVDLTKVQLVDVCATSVNTCAPSMGVGAECAIAPDGTMYIGIESDNYMYSANGWRFAEPFSAIATTPPPADEQATADQVDACYRAGCLAGCDGGNNPLQMFEDCPKDAGAD